MTLIEKSRLRKIMRLANVIAKGLEGDYRVRMSIALKMVYDSEKAIKRNQLSLDSEDAVRGFDSYLYAYGQGIYWFCTNEFYQLPEEIMYFVKQERLQQIKAA